jgi:hypothetical protein
MHARSRPPARQIEEMKAPGGQEKNRKTKIKKMGPKRLPLLLVDPRPRRIRNGRRVPTNRKLADFQTGRIGVFQKKGGVHVHQPIV